MSSLIPDRPEIVRVPRLIGLMGMDAVGRAQEHGLVTESPDRPEEPGEVGYVVRQYPPPGAEVPQGAVVTVWFDAWPGDEEGGSGVREPLRPEPGSGGLERELPEPDEGGPTGPGTEPVPG